MKIVCIGRNYRDHAKELGNEVPKEPVIFIKPSSCMSIGGKPFFIPDFTEEVHYELELVLRISKVAKAVERKFARRYYAEVGLGIDFTARDLQNELKAKGLPWEKAKSFDGAAAVGEFVPLDELPNRDSIKFQLHKNGELVQDGDSADMLFDFDAIIVEVSKYFRLTLGDLIFTGTPAGVGPVSINDHLVGTLEGRRLLDIRVK